MNIIKRTINTISIINTVSEIPIISPLLSALSLAKSNIKVYKKVDTNIDIASYVYKY